MRGGSNREFMGDRAVLFFFVNNQNYDRRYKLLIFGIIFLKKERKNYVLDRFSSDFSRPRRNDWSQRLFEQVIYDLVGKNTDNLSFFF